MSQQKPISAAKKPPFTKEIPVWRIASGVLCTAWLVGMAILAASFPRGLEETDEAAWILAASNPWASPGWGIFFGFGLHPLWLAGGACVLGFRWAGLLALMGSVILFVAVLRKNAFRIHADLLASHVGLVLPSLGLAALMTYTRGLRAPGYDWLLLFGGLCFASGWVCAQADPDGGKKTCGAFLVATGLVLVLVAKWTALPGYLAVSLVLFFLQRKEGRMGGRWIRYGIFWLVVWLALFFLYASPTGIYQVIQAGWSQTLTGTHDHLAYNYFFWFFQFLWVIFRALLWIVAISGLIWLGLRFFRGKPPALQEAAGLSFLAFLFVAILQGHWQGGEQTFPKGKMILAAWLSGVYFLTYQTRHSSHSLLKNRDLAIGRRIVWLLCLLPFLNGIGTANNLTNYINHGAVFFVAAGWIWLSQAHRNGLRPWLVVVPIIVLALICAARVASTPWNTFRIGSVWVQNTVVRTGPESNRLLLNIQAVRSLELISNLMRKSGYREGDPIIGLSSLCGLIYLLGGTSPGVCWYMDNPGAGTGSSANLANIPPDILKNAWLIIFEGDSTSFPSLAEFWPNRGIPFPHRLSGEFLWPMGDGEGILQHISIYQPKVPVL